MLSSASTSSKSKTQIQLFSARVRLRVGVDCCDKVIRLWLDSRLSLFIIATVTVRVSRRVGVYVKQFYSVAKLLQRESRENVWASGIIIT